MSGGVKGVWSKSGVPESGGTSTAMMMTQTGLCEAVLAYSRPRPKKNMHKNPFNGQILTTILVPNVEFLRALGSQSGVCVCGNILW